MTRLILKLSALALLSAGYAMAASSKPTPYLSPVAPHKVCPCDNGDYYICGPGYLCGDGDYGDGTCACVPVGRRAQ